ncbi:transglutaminase domain-containing protein [Pseudotenacibaculum sp. MALMAid0570]|uniref:transglutaminase domain-containing protein n=1 Tax=Pseudotenacibaculum sp. MALMAid0570 TaxID=3143938 RepID=UPI0032DF4475
MRKIYILLLIVLWILPTHSQQSDFKNINFSKADNIAQNYRKSKLKKLNKLTLLLTQNLNSDIEKFRAIYMWVTHNIASDHKLYKKNKRKRKKFANDSIALEEWNSKLKKEVFKKLIRRKKTICTGYAYLIKEMCEIAGIEARIIHGIGKTTELTEEDFKYPNHSWNAVKINGKWYLCDPTWASGISYPEQGRFDFDYNNGYFLSNPDLFVMTHYPLDPKWILLDKNVPSFNDFINAPILYGDAYKSLSKHILPKEMHHEIQKNDVITFQYLLKKGINPKKIKFIIVNGVSELTKTPNTIRKGNSLSLQLPFKNRGFYDVHLYFDNQLIATYTVRVTK